MAAPAAALTAAAATAALEQLRAELSRVGSAAFSAPRLDALLAACGPRLRDPLAQRGRDAAARCVPADRGDPAARRGGGGAPAAAARRVCAARLAAARARRARASRRWLLRARSPVPARPSRPPAHSAARAARASRHAPRSRRARSRSSRRSAMSWSCTRTTRSSCCLRPPTRSGWATWSPRGSPPSSAAPAGCRSCRTRRAPSACGCAGATWRCRRSRTCCSRAWPP